MDNTKLLIKPYNWDIYDNIICCFALDHNKDIYFLRFVDFPIICNIILSDPMNDKNVKDLLKKLGSHAPYNYSFEKIRRLYHYNKEDATNVMRLTFKNLHDAQYCINLIPNCVRSKDINITQWFQVNGHKITDETKLSTLDNEFSVSYDTLKLLQK
jgi:hypothetical protein